MSEVAAIGAQSQIVGFGLAGARIFPADDAAQIREAWRGLPAAIAVVILTAVAADVLGDDRLAPRAPLTVVLPT